MRAFSLAAPAALVTLCLAGCGASKGHASSGMSASAAASASPSPSPSTAPHSNPTTIFFNSPTTAQGPTTALPSPYPVETVLASPLVTSAGLDPGYFQVGAYSSDSSALPNTGVRADIDVIAQDVSTSLGNVFVGFWVSVMLDNAHWGQVGYLCQAGGAPQAFYYVFDLTQPETSPTWIQSYLFVPVTEGTHRFSMQVDTGTTWAFQVDGQTFGSFDMGSASSDAPGQYPVVIASEEATVPTPFAFKGTIAFNNIQVLKPSGWAPIATANAYGAGWGGEGNTQILSIANSSYVVGFNLPTLAEGTSLWSVP